MVGVPKSRGCQTCLSRRTKCDEARPACGNCIKYGSQCPGYDRGLKFVAVKHPVRPRGRRQPQPQQQRQSTSSPAVYARRPRPTSGSASAGGKLSVAQELVHVQPADVSQEPQPVTVIERIQSVLVRTQTVPCALLPPRDQCVGTLLEVLQETLSRDETLVSGSWIGAVTDRMHESRTFEISMAAFTCQLLGKLHRDEHIVAQSRSLYGTALGYLQQCLNHPREWKTPGTLGASMILCYYELFAGTITPDSWMQHARGVSRLIQLRGPKAHTDAWERAMLLSFRPVIIMNSLFSGEDCFLAAEPWQPVMRHKPGVATKTVSGTIMSPDNIDIGDRYFQLLAKLPGILRHAYVLREANKRGLPIDIHKALLLAEVAKKVHTDFLEWYSRLLAAEPAPREVTSNDSSSIFPTVLEFENPWVGALHMGYWASMLILQETLTQCRYPGDYPQRDLATNILRSIESVGQGMMGAYRCGYSVRIAFEFVDKRERDWMVMWLGRFEKSYAATSAKTYPDMEETNVSA